MKMSKDTVENSDEKNRWLWSRFVAIGNTIHLLGKESRLLEAKRALSMAHYLIKNDFLVGLSIQDQQLYESLLPKIAECLDGNRVIQAAVREYFLVQHCKAPSSQAGLHKSLFDIEFASKRSGIQVGFTCIVSNGPYSVRYYIKTHQHGPTNDNVKSMSQPDAKEFFVYKLLHAIGMGPEPHFIIPFHGTKRTIYIATKECHLKLLSDLNEDTSNHKALLQLDLMSRILCIQDVATNTSNCGQVGDKPMIVDFRVVTQQAGYVKADIVEKFYRNCEFSYANELMMDAVKTSEDVKFDIMKSSLKEWDLIANMDRVKSEMDGLIKRYRGVITFGNDLERYVQDVKSTILLMNA